MQSYSSMLRSRALDLSGLRFWHPSEDWAGGGEEADGDIRAMLAAVFPHLLEHYAQARM